MPVRAAALLPHPPLLVPELAGAAAGDLAPLRAACTAALTLVAAGDRALVLVGGGPAWATAGPGTRGSFAPYGVDVHVALPAEPLLGPLGPLPEPAPLDELPLSLAVAAWLLAASGLEPARLHALTLPGALDPRSAAAVGRSLAARAGSEGREAALVAMGDLSARRTPGAAHPAAAGYDARVAAALRAGDLDTLLALEPGDDAELQVAARVPLQVLAGAVSGAGPLRGEVLYEGAPYGVGYLVGVVTAAAP